MSVATLTSHPAVTAIVLPGSQWLPPDVLPSVLDHPASQDVMLLHVSVPDFDIQLTASIIDLQISDGYRHVVVEASIDPGVVATVTLKNEWVDGEIRPKEVSLGVGVNQHTPRAHFIGDSLYAVLGLAEAVNILKPEFNVDLRTRFKMPLPEISRLLQRRQTYYGLMLIERATGMQFDIPENISGDDVGNISFAYHAVVERDFMWLTNEVTAFIPATEQFLNWITDPRSTQENDYHFGPTPATRTILGQPLMLGTQNVVVKGIIQNLEEARREIAKLDGRLVPVITRASNRTARYSLPDAPILPDAPWDEKIEACIAIENKLNERLSSRYNDLAAAALAGFSPEEMDMLTARPVLDEDAQIIKD